MWTARGDDVYSTHLTGPLSDQYFVSGWGTIDSYNRLDCPTVRPGHYVDS